MEKFVVITYLFDFYQELLTDKQRNLLREYYFEDLSLGELSEQHQISRQSVFDTIKKAEQKLLDYESKLNLFSRHQVEQQTFLKIKALCEKMYAHVEGEYAIALNEIVTLVDGFINKI
ncbi:hypothetical protein CS063_07225 [Sporanaerobium hydrogeniformans]|uniref:Uncharacterized protein n=1 Tax=Sporanaerobium hydrogeniformans TaxID=3072179 RepID=A0AC61DCY6_9FIRM|nr:YlxM family DNA-binding protein [Sporanaerobium hydrogeniformans]PHV71115.1 hypothetical protein CS063_07225 [Sporanaerobium hydrogeniformans]